jgi:hypothetical protein
MHETAFQRVMNNEAMNVRYRVLLGIGVAAIAAAFVPIRHVPNLPADWRPDFSELRIVNEPWGCGTGSDYWQRSVLYFYQAQGSESEIVAAVLECFFENGWRIDSEDESYFRLTKSIEDQPRITLSASLHKEYREFDDDVVVSFSMNQRMNCRSTLLDLINELI